LDRIVFPAQGVKVGFWKISETSDELMQIYNPNEDEKTFLAHMPELRIKHFLASRLLLKTFHPDQSIEKDKFGKPHLTNSTTKVSWSHSGNYAAFISNENESTGIDIETLGPKVLRIEDKFCNKTDKANIHKTHHAQSLIIIWGAKESMYKWYGGKELDFKLHMTIEAFDLHNEGRFIGKIHKQNLTHEFILEYMIVDGHMATWIIEELKS